jgi:hypothetical protein
VIREQARKSLHPQVRQSFARSSQLYNATRAPRHQAMRRDWSAILLYTDNHAIGADETFNACREVALLADSLDGHWAF